jgi:hypothetical protein
MESESCGVLDTPLSRSMTTRCGAGTRFPRQYYYSIIGRPIQSLLSERTARPGCFSPCRRATAS